MSTLQQTEQTAPSVPAASTQLLYPKVGGMYIMAADGVEKQIIVSNSYVIANAMMPLQVNYFGI
jgi:hypothetical protein